ncbi:hypothetical protein CBR_g41442 [Chara braunii]|uniref:Histone-lysine N-methyltransferase n=1 Tax=Chara braunii TaxID=69332 RepID=A0A388LVT7_CHABU|nr:hypothetical protein CBR_g41442 [Chara braunii]|eukprot:GBG86447.1 hypothetical protein CBR_g41442 [Chara braunii]
MGKPRKEKTASIWGADDGFSYLCCVCDDFGELICCEQCRRGFHCKCLGLAVLPEEDTWMCPDCRQGKVYCFMCKKEGRLNEAAFKCAVPECGKFYHRECQRTFNVKGSRKKALDSGYICPHHFCSACDELGPRNRMQFRCLKCPIAYHERCIPDGTPLLTDMPGWFLCWRHEDDWKSGEKDWEPTSDISVIFDRLPLPDILHNFKLPHSIHEAVRRMNNKPPEFTHIKQNVFLIKKPRRRSEDHSMQCSCTQMGEDGVCGRDCICRMLFTGCSKNCGCGEKCTNLPFHKLKGRKIRPVKTERCGWGVEAAENIRAGDFIIEYVGEVIDDEICEKRLWAMKARGETNFYLCEISKDMVVDATFKGNISRFINHSCDPNCELQKWEMEGSLRVGVFATRDIPEGANLTYDYQFIQFGQDQYCLCGSEECRGKLGAKPSKHKPVKNVIADALADSESRDGSLDALSRLRPCKKPRTVLHRGYGVSRITEYFPTSKVGHLSFKASAKIQACRSTPNKRRTDEEVISGRRVQIWWPLDQRYYRGTVGDYNHSSRTHQIEYDDGDTEELDLSKETWHYDESSSSVGTSRRGPISSARSETTAQEVTVATGVSVMT